MSTLVIALVLFAAMLHATWNALLHSGADRLWQVAVMSIPSALVALVGIGFLPLPATGSWPFIAASTTLQIAYALFLVAAYQSGDFGQSYPVARGTAPLLVAFGAAVFAHEYLSPVAVVGIVLVMVGIIALAFKGRRFRTTSIPAAFATGCCIAGYTVVDGIGVRLSGNSFAYIGCVYLLWSISMLGIFIARRGVRALRAPVKEVAKGVGGGLAAMTTYGVIIWSLQYGPMGPISALRETSVLFPAAIGWIFMHERLPARQLVACGIIGLGAVMLNLS